MRTISASTARNWASSHPISTACIERVLAELPDLVQIFAHHLRFFDAPDHLALGQAPYGFRNVGHIEDFRAEVEITDDLGFDYSRMEQAAAYRECFYGSSNKVFPFKRVRGYFRIP